MISDLATIFLRNFRLPVFQLDRPRFSPKIVIPNPSGYWTVINLDEFESIGTYWIALYIDNYNVNYYDSFGVEHIPKEMKNSWETKI